MAGVAWLVLPYVWSQGLGRGQACKAQMSLGWRRGQRAKSQTQAGEALRQHVARLFSSASFLCLVPSEAQHPKKPTQRQDSRQLRAQHRTRYFPTDSLTRAPSLSPHLTSCILRQPQQQDTRGTTHGRVLPAPFPWARQTCSTGAVYKSSLTLLRRQPDLQVQAERQAS
jgi:hypothetical protein